MTRRKAIPGVLSPSDQAKVMTIAEVADYLNCHYGTVYRLVRGGELPAFRLGGSWRFLRSDLEQWIASRTGAGAVEKRRKPQPAASKPPVRVRGRKPKPKSRR
jgi:excisionase family DNA binding protein